MMEWRRSRSKRWLFVLLPYVSCLSFSFLPSVLVSTVLNFEITPESRNIYVLIKFQNLVANYMNVWNYQNFVEDWRFCGAQVDDQSWDLKTDFFGRNISVPPTNFIVFTRVSFNRFNYISESWDAIHSWFYIFKISWKIHHNIDSSSFSFHE